MRKHLTREFKVGFAKGYMSPFNLFFQPSHHYTRPTKNIVSIAWAKVGRTLEDSTQREAIAVGKITEEQRAQ